MTDDEPDIDAAHHIDHTKVEEKSMLYLFTFGFLNIWAPISFMPAILLPFFKSGPFAWSGLFVLWIPAFIFIVWFVLTTVMLLKAIDEEQRALSA